MTRMFRLTQRCSYGGTIACLSVFHLLTEDDTVVAANVGADWMTNIVPAWKLETPTNFTFVSVETQRVYPSIGDEALTALSGTGSRGTAGAAPAVVAMVITWRTSAAGRRNRGRTYLAAMNITGGSPSSWFSTELTRGTNIATAIKTRYVAAGNPFSLVLGVYSRLNGGATPPYALAGFKAVQAFTVQPYFATMGSRRGGRGM